MLHVEAEEFTDLAAKKANLGAGIEFSVRFTFEATGEKCHRQRDCLLPARVGENLSELEMEWRCHLGDVNPNSRFEENPSGEG